MNSSTKRTGIILSIAVFLGGIGGGIVFPIIPILGLKFLLPPFFIGMILASNRIARLLFNQLVGQLVDKLGGKIPLILGLIVESIGATLFVAALYLKFHGIMLFLGRFIWGAGSAFLFIAANTIALNISTTKTRGKSTAIVRIALSLGVPAGLVLGGVLSSLFGDVVAFISSALASLIGALVVVTGLNAPQVKVKNMPSLLDALSRTLKHKSLLFISAFNFLAFFTLQGVILTTLVLYVKERHITFIYSDPRFSSGVLMSFMMLAAGAGGFISGRIVDRVKLRSAVTFPSLVGVIIGLLLLSFTHTLPALIGALILLGCGTGINNVALLSIMGDMIPLDIRGRSVAVFQFMGDLGGMLGPVFGVQAALSIGFTTTYLISMFMFLLAVPMLFAILKQERLYKSSAITVQGSSRP